VRWVRRLATFLRDGYKSRLSPRLLEIWVREPAHSKHRGQAPTSRMHVFDGGPKLLTTDTWNILCGWRRGVKTTLLIYAAHMVVIIPGQIEARIQRVVYNSSKWLLHALEIDRGKGQIYT
jgi:hypothetical protein